MLVQCLIMVGSMFVLAGVVLTSTLVSAKAILYQNALSKTQTAMGDATAAFVASEQSLVQRYGTEQQTWPIAKPTSEPLCASVVGASAAPCPYLATMSWAVTGTSAKGPITASASPATSDASNLATAVDEQRISATIAVAVSNAAGTAVYASRSREVTARIFNAPPYVVVTGVRDVGSAAGGYRASEGDTSGSSPGIGSSSLQSAPDPAAPAAYTDTRILTTIDCVNSQPGAQSAIGHAYYDPRFHPYGNHVWTYESSCLSGRYATNGAPPNFSAAAGTAFETEPGIPHTPWQKGDENDSAFPR